MDPQQTEDGQPYGPVRFKEIVKDCYLISKYLHTSYTDALQITPLERSYLLEFLVEDARQREQAMERQKREAAAKRNR